MQLVQVLDAQWPKLLNIVARGTAKVKVVGVEAVVLKKIG